MSADEVTIRGFEVHVPETDDLLAEASIHNEAIDEGIAAAAATPAAANGYGTVLYRTFIPQAKIDAPVATCDYGSGYKFGGDNRGFSHSPASARTTLGANLTVISGSHRQMPNHEIYVMGNATGNWKTDYTRKYGSGRALPDRNGVPHSDHLGQWQLLNNFPESNEIARVRPGA